MLRTKIPDNDRLPDADEFHDPKPESTGTWLMRVMVIIVTGIVICAIILTLIPLIQINMMDQIASAGILNVVQNSSYFASTHGDVKTLHVTNTSGNQNIGWTILCSYTGSNGTHTVCGLVDTSTNVTYLNYDDGKLIDNATHVPQLFAIALNSDNAPTR